MELTLTLALALALILILILGIRWSPGVHPKSGWGCRADQFAGVDGPSRLVLRSEPRDPSLGRGPPATSARRDMYRNTPRIRLAIRILYVLYSDVAGQASMRRIRGLAGHSSYVNGLTRVKRVEMRTLWSFSAKAQSKYPKVNLSPRRAESFEFHTPDAVTPAPPNCTEQESLTLTLFVRNRKGNPNPNPNRTEQESMEQGS